MFIYEFENEFLKIKHYKSVRFVDSFSNAKRAALIDIEVKEDFSAKDTFFNIKGIKGNSHIEVSDMYNNTFTVSDCCEQKLFNDIVATLRNTKNYIRKTDNHLSKVELRA